MLFNTTIYQQRKRGTRSGTHVRGADVYVDPDFKEIRDQGSGKPDAQQPGKPDVQFDELGNPVEQHGSWDPNGQSPCLPVLTALLDRR